LEVCGSSLLNLGLSSLEPLGLKMLQLSSAVRRRAGSWNHDARKERRPYSYCLHTRAEQRIDDEGIHPSAQDSFYLYGSASFVLLGATGSRSRSRTVALPRGDFKLGSELVSARASWI
jgi:hypothetical protein